MVERSDYQLNHEEMWRLFSKGMKFGDFLHRRCAILDSQENTSKGVLEIAKFAVYVSVSIGLMYFFANNAKNLQKFMGNRQYVIYPPEAPRPPSPEEIRERARELAQKRNNQ